MNPPDPAGPRDELFGVGAAGAQSFLDQLLEYAPAPIYMASLEGRYVFVNRAWEELTHIPFRHAVGRLTGEMYTPETARRLKEANRRVIETGAPLHVEEVVEAADGTHYYHSVKFPVRNAAGALVAVGGVSIDVSERRRAEGIARALSRRLLEVQEQERRRIARELHDEIGQILTGLHLSLERGGRLGEAALRHAVGGACEVLRELTGRVRDLSLRLRPSMLDDLGLLPALLWHFERYTAQTGVRVDFEQTGLGRRFSPEGETAAYRIVQEALTNAARHAGVGEVAVRISLDRLRLRIDIEDRGAGFDADAVRRSGGGNGLSGMGQRVALLGGRLDVTSASGAGTRLVAEWPEGVGDGADGGGR